MNETKEIEYYRKMVYGNELNYILDDRLRKTFRKLTHTESIMLGDMETFGELGFTFKEVLAPRN